MTPPAGRWARAPLARAAFRSYMGAARWLRTRRWIARRLFGLKVADGSQNVVLWDFTTLALRKALERHARDGHRVHEIGVGEVAALCVFLRRRCRLILSGVDVQASRVRTARATLALNGITDVSIECRDLFGNDGARYDRVFFNAAYIPSEVGRHMGFLAAEGDEARRAGWDGGADGLFTVRRFLEGLPRHLGTGGLGLLGVNTLYVPESRVRNAVRLFGLATVDIVRMPFNPSVVFVLAPASIKPEPGAAATPTRDGEPAPPGA